MRGPQQLHSYEKDTLLNEGKYRIEKELNRGGTAIVYAAEEVAAKRYVALKVMNCPAVVPVQVVKREINFSSTTVHKNIVRLLDVFAEGRDKLVIVWELISGPDLLELLNECGGQMPEEMACFYFVQLLKAVLFMHEKGFCHRDIKAENCMVERETHRLKLIDFGLSKHLESAQTLGVGTPDYMCPEMLQNSGRREAQKDRGPYDAKAVDAWAMGVVMYLLVSGKYPFEDPGRPNNIAHTINNILLAKMRPLPDHVHPSCVALIKSLLQGNTDMRTKLEDIATNTWLRQQAFNYGRKLGREDLVVMDNERQMVRPGPPPQPVAATQSTSPEAMDVDTRFNGKNGNASVGSQSTSTDDDTEAGSDKSSGMFYKTKKKLGMIKESIFGKKKTKAMEL